MEVASPGSSEEPGRGCVLLWQGQVEVRVVAVAGIVVRLFPVPWDLVFAVACGGNGRE